MKKIFTIIVSSIAIIAAAAVVWHVQEKEYYKSRLQTKKHPKLWEILFENRIPEADTLIVGKWQNKENPFWHKVYLDEYDEEEKLFWGKEWDESEDVYEEDLQYHGNGWFRWEKRGKILHEYATMDMRDVPIYRNYKVCYLSNDSLAYFEVEYKKKIFSFVRRDNALTEEDIQDIISEENKTDIIPKEEADIDEYDEDVDMPEKPVTTPAKRIVASLSVDKSSVSAPAEGISVKIAVTCNTEWEIDPSSNSMYSVSANGNTLTVDIFENSSTDSRADFFTVRTKDRTKEQRITLSQNGKSNSSPIKTTYNVHNVSEDYTIHGYQITNYTDKARELKVLRDAISKWKEVRTGAISESGTGIVIYGDGGFQATMRGHEFKAFGEAIDKIKKSDTRISDVAFNGDGNYVFILGNCGYSIYGIPQKFEEVLKELNNTNEKILSVSLDDDDNWAYVSAKHYGASDSENLAFIQEASEKYGKLESVCITTKGIVVCCRNGVYFKNIPKSVVDALIKFNNSGMKPKVVKFTDSGTYLITDGESSYTYSM